jgi:hypothetical protein
MASVCIRRGWISAARFGWSAVVSQKHWNCGVVFGFRQAHIGAAANAAASCAKEREPNPADVVSSFPIMAA